MKNDVEIRDMIDTLNDDDLLYLWNEACKAHNKLDLFIQEMCLLNDELAELAFLDALDALNLHKFSPIDNYFYYDEKGNICSCSYLDDDDCPFDYERLNKMVVGCDFAIKLLKQLYAEYE